MRVIAIVLQIVALSFLPALTFAQDEPLVTATLSADETPVGQPLTLTIEILVPTWMPSPPVFPDLEQPDLLVRQPPRAGSPISQTVNGETWSGISRSYVFVPLTADQFSFPNLNLKITWSDPMDQTQITQSLPLTVPDFRSIIPVGAENLQPPLFAKDIQLEQDIQAGSDLQVGDPIKRTITAKITGTTPILLPLLLKDLPEDSPLRTYPEELRTNEELERGSISGNRIETVTYLAQQGGTATLPPIELSWFDVEEAVVKTASLPGATFQIAYPPPPPPDTKAIVFWVIITLCATALFWGVMQRLWPRVLAFFNKVTELWTQSPYSLAQQVVSALRNRDLSASYCTLENWSKQLANDEKAEISELLTPLGKLKYSKNAEADEMRPWKEAERNFRSHYRAVLRRRLRIRKIPLREKLNP